MTITQSKCGVWILDDTHKKIQSGYYDYFIRQQIWSWGSNTYGQLGDGTVIHRSSPIQVPGTEWNDISSGQCHSLARKTDGTLWSWGRNGEGSLGDDTIIHRSSPVQVPGTQWNDISGTAASLARKCVL